MSMKSILKKIYTNLRKKAIEPYIYSEKYVKLDDVYDEIYKAEKEYNEGLRCVEIRNKAIDEFAEKFIYKAVCEGCSGCTDCYENEYQNTCEDWKAYMEIAEQMKGV